jgi:hypothetical protein
MGGMTLKLSVAEVKMKISPAVDSNVAAWKSCGV